MWLGKTRQLAEDVCPWNRFQKSNLFFILFFSKIKLENGLLKKKIFIFSFVVSNEKNYQWCNIRLSWRQKKRDVCRPTLPPRVSLSPDQLLLWWDTPAIQWSIEWLVFFLCLFVCLFVLVYFLSASGGEKKWQSVKSSGCSLSVSRVVGTGSYSISMLTVCCILLKHMLWVWFCRDSEKTNRENKKKNETKKKKAKTDN